MPGARAIATFIAVALLVHRGTFFTAATHDDLRYSKYRCQTFVECENGFVQGEGTYTQEDEEDPTSFAGDARAVTCHDRCAELGGNCCVDEQDCGACVATGGGATGGTTCYGGFTGKVCADDGQKSCDGQGSGAGTVEFPPSSRGVCKFAKIAVVIDGCHGLDACNMIAAGGGHLSWIFSEDGGRPNEEYVDYKYGQGGPIRGSCWGVESCSWMAVDLGNMPYVENSCRGDMACRGVAVRGGVRGLLSSCNGKNACRAMAQGALNGPRGVVRGPVALSCNAERSCDICEDDDDCSTTGGNYPVDTLRLNTTFLNGSCNAKAACSQYVGIPTDGLTCGCPGGSCPTAPYSESIVDCLAKSFSTGDSIVSVCAGDADECTETTRKFRVKIRNKRITGPRSIRLVDCLWAKGNLAKRCRMFTYTRTGSLAPKYRRRVRDFCVNTCAGY